MADRQATMLVADDLLVALNGKLHFSGIYPGDIAIPADPTIVSQLVFYFMVETDLKEPLQSLALEISLPQSEPIRLPGPAIQPPTVILPGRTRQFYRWPQLVQSVFLRPGKIQAKLIHESGEIIVGGPWVVMATKPEAPPTQ
jgi:hypothetical protein